MTNKLPAHIEFSQSISRYVDINMSDSCAESLTVQELCSLAGETLDNIDLSYANLKGDNSLRNYISELYPNKLGFSGEQVLTFAGAQEAIAACYKALITEGDEVILCRPYYPSLYHSVLALGGIPKVIDLQFDNGWQYQVDHIERIISDRTKLVVINSPHNPTGATFDIEHGKSLIKTLKSRGGYLLLDDVAAFSNPSSKNKLGELLSYENAISISVMSKSFGLAGVRIGWACSKNELLLKAMLLEKVTGSICTSRVDESLAVMALKNKEAILKRNCQIIDKNKTLFDEFVKTNRQLSWHRPEEGILTTVKVCGVECIETWCRELVINSGVLLLPATLFGLPGPYVRLGLGKQKFVQGLDKLQNYL